MKSKSPFTRRLLQLFLQQATHCTGNRTDSVHCTHVYGRLASLKRGDVCITLAPILNDKSGIDPAANHLQVACDINVTLHLSAVKRRTAW